MTHESFACCCVFSQGRQESAERETG